MNKALEQKLIGPMEESHTKQQKLIGPMEESHTKQKLIEQTRA